MGTRYFGTTNPKQPSLVQISSYRTANVSGDWSLVLDDNTSRTAVLTLFQNGNAVYGTGDMNQGNNTSLKAAASGTVKGSRLNMNLVLLGKLSLYRLSLTISEDSINGSYSAFTPGTYQIAGIAKGRALNLT